MRAGHDITGPAVTMAVFALSLSGLVFLWVRYRAEIHEAAGLSAKGASS